VTAYDDEDRNVRVEDPKRIAMNYLDTWFLTDFLSLIPVEEIKLILNNSGSDIHVGVFRYNSLLKLVRLLKLMRLNAFLEKYLLDTCEIPSSLIRLAKFNIFVCYMIHFFACIWYFSARESSFNPQTWVARNSLQDQTEAYKYLVSVYWATQTITTVGFGDILSKTYTEFYINLFWMTIGSIYYAFLLSQLHDYLLVSANSEMIKEQKFDAL
jgi:hyperpolarization activated cyclic nucleotide-gated potassium channel 2